jgi:hypothetical protein
MLIPCPDACPPLSAVSVARDFGSVAVFPTWKSPLMTVRHWAVFVPVQIGCPIRSHALIVFAPV